MAQKFCTKCGAKLDENKDVCPSCGAPIKRRVVHVQQTAQPQTQSQAKANAVAEDNPFGEESYEKPVAIWVFTVLAFLAYTFLLIWWSTGVVFMSNGSSYWYSSYTFFRAVSSWPAVRIMLYFFTVSFVLMIVHAIIVGAKREKVRTRLVLSLLATVACLGTLITFFVAGEAYSNYYSFPTQTYVTCLAALPTIIASDLIITILNIVRVAKKK